MESCVNVAPGIYQVRLPLPFALRIVNCYLLQDDTGWTIVDSGLNRSESQVVWQSACAMLQIRPADITRIVLTHFHPDHYGLAGWLQEWTSGETPVYMSPREAELASEVWGRADRGPEPMAALFSSHGVPKERLESMAVELGRLRRMTLPHPCVTHLEPGTTLHMGGRAFQAIYAPGHSDGQLVFYSPDDRLILCGDQVLIKITPHIGLWPESEPDPLGRYLNSLHALADLDVQLGLPGHGPLIHDWQTRLAELEHHHALRLEQMGALVRGGVTGYTVGRQVFDFDKLTPHEMRFAVAETVAHLELLVARERLRRTYDGVWIYHQAVEDTRG
ncbi:MAG: MBL fold metallo-hydrolase [Chloroflexales bacterium]|nr:MBL fold metallo-hydrolase [Chloroflexales bacterium]